MDLQCLTSLPRLVKEVATEVAGVDAELRFLVIFILMIIIFVIVISSVLDALLRFQATAIQALQEAAEALLVTLLQPPQGCHLQLPVFLIGRYFG